MPFWRRTPSPEDHLPKHDRGKGSFDDYAYDLIPKKRDTVLRLAECDPHQDVLADLAASADPDSLVTATPARGMDQERVDAPIEVRLFSGRSVTAPVGRVPRGMESVYDEAIRRLDGRGDKPRIPVMIVSTKQGYRVDLLIGFTR